MPRTSLRSRILAPLWFLVHRTGLLFVGALVVRLFGGGGTRVLCYHRIAPGGRPGDLAPDRFRTHLRHLTSRYRLLAADELVALLSQAEAPPRNGIVVTFDDGYGDLLDEAVPALQEAGVPATFFVLTGALPGPGSMPNGEGPLLDAEGVAELRRRGFAVGSHTRTHVRLPDAAPEVAREEIGGSRDDLARILEAPPDLFAYPWGAADDAVANIAREAGYRAAFTTAGGAVRAGADPHRLPRIHLPGNASVSRLACEAAGLVSFLRGVK